MSRRLLLLLVFVFFPIANSHADTVNWDEATSGSSAITGMLDGISITVNNTSSDGNPTVGTGFGKGVMAGDAGLYGGLMPSGVEYLRLEDRLVGDDYTYIFGSALTKDFRYHFSGGDHVEFIFNTSVTNLSQIGGSWDAGSLTTDNDGSNGINGGGGSFVIPAGTTDFKITRTTSGPTEVWWSTFQSIPEPGSGIILVGLTTLCSLVRRRK